MARYRGSMVYNSSRSSPAASAACQPLGRPKVAPGMDPRLARAMTVVHSVVKEVDWTRRIASRLRATGDASLSREQLGLIEELAHSASVQLHALLDARTPCVPQYASLGSVVDQAVATVRRRSDRARIIESVPDCLRTREISGDLGPILVALLENAVDFSNAGSAVRLHARESPTGISVSVDDSGRGMSANVLRRCIEPGFTTRKQAGGHGIGLHQASQDIAALGGGLEIRSRDGFGTRVKLSLPLHALG